MANFEEAYLITLNHEGTYSNDTDDVGGETYKGISRNYHPDWEGWYIVDRFKTDLQFPNNLDDSIVLDLMVKRFYKRQYWNIFLGDYITNQQIANELFDTSVNMGISRAVMYLQIGLNILNKNEKLYKDIVEDGLFGMKTLKALDNYLAINKCDNLYKIMNILQGAHYINYASKSPIQEKFMEGWLSRVEFIKH